MIKTDTKLSLILFTLLLLSFNSNLLGQSDFDQLDGGSSISEIPGLLTEKVIKISDNKNIFLISNSSNGFSKGDFISIIIGNKLTARALIAKDAGPISGIKIIKIYSLDNWSRIYRGSEIQVLKGDDSYFLNMLRKSESSGDEQDALSLIEDETDLYNSTMLEDDIELEENSKRILKTDNLVFGYYGMIAGKNSDNSSASFSIWTASWAYQLNDNIWGEATLGRTLVADFPSGGLDTTLTLISFKLKYTIKGPFFSYIQPYVGYQAVTADSPGAGENVGVEEGQKELDLIAEVEQSEPIFGVSLIKRLVPGWFVRVDLGTDIMAGGFGLEF